MKAVEQGGETKIKLSGARRALEAGRLVHERLRPKQFRAPSLDALNFLTADVRGALGPYITVFLAADQHWDLGQVGLVTTLGGWAGLAMQTPAGALLDATQRKRGLLAAALAVLGLGALIIALYPAFWPVLAANTLMQVVSGLFEPGVAALTVGLFARRDLTRRMGRNAAFARAGNLSIAVLAGFVAWRLSSRDVFLMVPVFALFAIVSALTIPHSSIDLRRARGLRTGRRKRRDDGGEEIERDDSGPSGWQTLIRCRPLLIYAACALLFEFAAGPMLTLAGQKMGMLHPGLGLVITSACIVAQQAGMLPSAILVGRVADRLGHRTLLLAAFAVLPVQGILSTLGDSVAFLVAIQFLGGIGVGLFTALNPLLLSDLMRGTGRYNLAQGAIATVLSLGVSSSGLVTELIVGRFGYAAAFCTSAAVGAAALVLLWFIMPETQPDLAQEQD